MVAEVNGISLYYEQQGAGPDLVLLPGLGANVNAFYAQLRGLSPVMRVTAVDLRGHGRSAVPPGPYAIRDMAEDAAALLRHAGVRRAVVAGSSMASLVIAHLGVEHPELVAALIFVGGFAGLSQEARERFEARARTAEAEGMAPLADLVPTTALGAHTHATQPALVGLFRQMLLANNPAGYAASCRAIKEADTTALLPRIHCPALIMYGEQEQVAPLAAARALKAGIRHARVRVIPKAGHLPFLEQPAAFNAAVLEFVSGLEQLS